MSFPKGFLDELKARIRVSEVVGRKVKLIRRGREFVGLSPFTNEKSPSFTVNDDKQFWHCFSSGEHGDIIKFLEKTENLSFLEAVERLAAEAGLDMPRRDVHAVERAKEEATLIDVMEMAAAFFRERLTAGVGAEARAYLERRGLKQATVEAFGLGYAPEDRHALLRHLKAKDVSVAQMAEAGLVIAGADIPEPYDRFRNRVMFPIADSRGRTIAFGGRALDPEAKAKYLNSPETPLFHKGRGLYNLHRARKPAYDAGTVVVVEGYMDVIALAQADFENVVAPLGTALTEDQIGLMWRMAPEPILCFDGDKAGHRAAFRAVERVLPLLKPGHSIRFALLPEGKDPDDLVREEGRAAVQKVLDGSLTATQMLFKLILHEERLEGADDRARLQAKADATVAAIADPVVKRHYQSELKNWLWQHFGRVFKWHERDRSSQRGRPSKEFITAVAGGSSRSAPNPNQCEKELLAHLLNHPQLLRFEEEILLSVRFDNPVYASIAKELVTISNREEIADAGHLQGLLQSKGFDSQLSNILNSTIATRGTASPKRSDEDAQEGFWASIMELRRLNHIDEIKLEFNRLATLNDKESDELIDRLKFVAREFRECADERIVFQLGEEYRALRRRLPPAGVELRRATA